MKRCVVVISHIAGEYEAERAVYQAKKRQLIEQRLQSKLKNETDHVRQIEEARKDKVTANRKEEDLLLKDSIVSHLIIYCMWGSHSSSGETSSNTSAEPLEFLVNR